VKPNQSPIAHQAASTNDPSSLLPSLPPDSRVLIIRQRSLGDLVLETSAVAALKAWRPDLRIYVLVEPRFAAVFEGNPLIDEVIFSVGLLATALQIRRRGFSAVFNQHGGPRSALLTGVSGSPVRIGWKDHQYSFFYNVQVPEAQEFYGRPDVHAVEHRMSQFYWAGLPRGPIPPTKLFAQADARHSVARKLAANGIGSGQAYAVLQPGARVLEMRWPAAKFAELAGWLRAKYGISSVVNCSAQDAAVAHEIRAAIQGRAAVADNLDVRELIALISSARLFVGNDSGPAHIAAALQRPTVVIFSRTDPAQWRPLHSGGRVVSTGAQFEHPRGDKAIVIYQPRPVIAISVDEIRVSCAELLEG
jgi:ADP-heptose:LPS heptosyltransferase